MEGGCNLMLEQLLDGSYHAVHDILQDMTSAIAELHSRLHLDPDGHVNKAKDWTAFRKLWFSIGRQRQDSLMQRIRECNLAFQRLVKQSLDLEPIRVRKRRRRRNFVAARQEAGALFDLLDWSLQCQCRHQHALFMCLNSFQQSDKSDRCHFVLVTGSARLAVFETMAKKGTNAQQTAVQQLCHSLFNNPVHAPPKDIGFIEDSKSTRRNIVVSDVCPGIVDRFECGKITCSGGERRCLALIMAVSVLRLYKTPWVDERWVRECIGSARKIGGSVSASPLVERALTSTPQRNDSTLQAGNLRLLSIRSEPLFAFGIFLIELCFKKPFVDLQRPEDVIPGGLLECLTEFRTATRLIPAVYSEAGQRYGDAVRRCIRCDFDFKTYDLDDEDFCQAVFEKVVAPLEEDVRVIDGPEALAECSNGFRLK